LRAELALAGERTRLSREIHDGVGNALAAAVLRLEVAARMSEKQRPETGRLRCCAKKRRPCVRR
jgi:signal transduction histidine kinase